MADCTLSSTCFCAENLSLVRALKPFRFYEMAALKRLLESAWTKLGDKNKVYYVKKVITARSLGCLQKMEEGDDSKKGEDGAFEIYRTEMRLILLQDPAFVKHQFHEMRDVIQQGWKRLNKRQKLHFCKRAVLAEDSVTESVEEQQQRRSVKWFFPDCAWLTNNIDRNAFNEYATITHDANPSLNTDTLWAKWMELTYEKREYYYQKVIQRNVHTNAKLAFVREKTTENPKNFPQYSAEAKLLHQTWNDLSDLAQQVYISKSYEKILEADQNPLTRFRREHYADKDYYCKTTFDDIASRLEPIEPYKNFEFLPAEHVDVNRLALLVYIEKMRPNLLKKKGMIQKRNWEVNYILRDQWNALNKEEQQPYYDIVSRFLEISKDLREWKVEARDFADKNDVLYKVDAETKKKHFQIALRNRKILVKKYPDLLEYFAWIKNCNPDTNTDKSVASELSLDTEKADVVVQNVENTTNKSDDKTITDTYYYTILTDFIDNAAFWEYQNAVRTMTFEYVEPHVCWKQFVNLTEEERNVYYDAVFKKKLLKKARVLFAIDHCPIIEQSNEIEHYAKELPYLNQTWEGLSDPAKQYYIDLGEPEVLKQEKELKENGRVKCENESQYDVDKKPSELDGIGALTYKEGHSIFRGADYKSAFSIYLQKQHKKLSEEPGMADKRYFQLALILEQRFKDLSDEERTPYFDVVNRLKELENYRKGLPVDWCSIYSKKNNYSYKYENACEEEIAACREEAKQNFVNLLEKFPDLGEYCHWTVYHNSKMVTLAAKEPTKKDKAAEESAKTTESSNAWEVVDDTNVLKSEETTSITDAEPDVDDNTSEKSEVVATWELVEDEEN